ncbi:MAG: hypothetical protein KJN92_14335 [Gemmatimonadetes bacterium]|nr:hypothetical protein [Gemmatimonadota bacterium]
MFGSRTRSILALAAVAAVGSACESGTGPEDRMTFDAEAALANHEAMALILQSDAMEGFRALGGGVSFLGVAPEAAFALGAGRALDNSLRGGNAEKLGARLFTAWSQLGGAPSHAPIISQFRRGKTFVYDPEVGHYVMDSEIPGAPATGVRFILYQPGSDGKPDPANEVGHADLIDEGDGSEEDIALRLVVIEGTDTILNYRTTLDVRESGGEITVSGFFQGEFDRLDFDIVVTGSDDDGGETVDISFEMGIAERDFLIQGSVFGTESDSGEGGEIALLVEHGEDSFSVAAIGTDDSISGTVHLNGALFANITGDPDDPTITGATGEALTFIEMLVLRQIIDSTEDVFDFWEDLLDPVDELVLLAFIL